MRALYTYLVLTLHYFSMNLFKDSTYTWWQIGIFKLALICIGIVIGAYFHEAFAPYLLIVILVAIVAALYILFVWYRQ